MAAAKGHNGLIWPQMAPMATNGPGGLMWPQCCRAMVVASACKLLLWRSIIGGDYSPKYLPRLGTVWLKRVAQPNMKESRWVAATRRHI